MLLTGPKQIFNPASGREHDCASHCGGAGVTPEDHRLHLNIPAAIPPLISALMHAGHRAAATAGLGSLSCAFVFSLHSFAAAENPSTGGKGMCAHTAVPLAQRVSFISITVISRS